LEEVGVGGLGVEVVGLVVGETVTVDGGKVLGVEDGEMASE
jgi:hypothetical protein